MKNHCLIYRAFGLRGCSNEEQTTYKEKSLVKMLVVWLQSILPTNGFTHRR